MCGMVCYEDDSVIPIASFECGWQTIPDPITYDILGDNIFLPGDNGVLVLKISGGILLMLTIDGVLVKFRNGLLSVSITKYIKSFYFSFSVISG